MVAQSSANYAGLKRKNSPPNSPIQPSAIRAPLTIEHPGSACDYDSFLPSIGFHVVSKTNYSPQKGDIIVLEAVEGHPHGHIAMYSGSNWISDFVQRDMWGGSAYRDKAEYTLFRR